MTSFAIALHLLGKNLMNLGYLKEARHFITKAHYVITKMVVGERKFDLELAIQMDMKTVLDKTRKLVTQGDPNAPKVIGASGKQLAERDSGALTEEDIARSLAAIKSSLTTVKEAPSTAEEAFTFIVDQSRQLPDNQEGL